LTSRADRIISYTLLAAVSAFALYPLLAIIFLALHEPSTPVQGVAVPDDPSFRSLSEAWTTGNFGSAIRSSFIITTAAVVISVVLSILAGYAFGVMRFRGSNVIFFFLLFGIVVPYEATIYALFWNFERVGLTNTYWAVILPYIGFSVAFGSFWMRASFRSAPVQLLDAARVDGAGAWLILWRILVPLARPAIVALTVLLFIWNWNEFLLQLVMLQSEELRTAPLSVAIFAGSTQFRVDRPLLGAAALWVALPIVVIYIVLQRQFLRGMLSGAVMG
jgi:raffinose/stachyose/melibiose transport system permease protein